MNKFNRRDFIKITSAASIMAAYPSIAAEKLSNDKSVIMIWLGGGISQYEFTHPNSDGVEGFQSVNGAVSTNVPGIDIDSLWTGLAKRTDKLSIVRSCSHTNANHEQATHYMQTSIDLQDNNPTPLAKEPSYGSICSSFFGPNKPDGMPTYVQASLNGIFAGGSAWLGNQYNPYEAGANSDNLVLSVPKDRFDDRRQLLQNLDQLQKKLENPKFTTIDEYRKQSYNMLLGDVKDVFKPKDSSDDFLTQYLMMACKVAEKGGMFITAHLGGWDMHSSIGPQTKSLVPRTDAAISSLLDYLHTSGLYKNVLVVIATEFGRTKLNGGNPSAGDPKPGRDHHSGIVPLVFAGGGFNHGRIIGAADKRAVSPITDIYGPADIGHTILTYLGIPKTYQKVDSAGRPRYLVPEGKFIL